MLRRPPRLALSLRRRLLLLPRRAAAFAGSGFSRGGGTDGSSSERRRRRGGSSPEERRAQLSLDLEFCCFSYAAFQNALPCATCPFPEDQRPDPPDPRGAHQYGAEDELRRACVCLGLDHRRLGATSHAELRAAFRGIAFASHPDTADTAAEAGAAADPALFQRAFTSYSLLRAHVVR